MTEKRPTSEQEIVELVRTIDVKAPESLHRRLESMIAARDRGGRRRRGLFGARRPATAPTLAAAGAIVAVAAAIAIVLGTGGSSSRSFDDRAATLALSPATQAPPRESPRVEAELAANVEGVAFPYWEGRFGWRSVGARRDRIDGRDVTTVFYADRHGRRVGYAIVAGLPAPRTSGGHTVRREGTPYRLTFAGGVPVVSWLRHGHLCVISGRGVSGATLLRLASWEAKGSLA